MRSPLKVAILSAFLFSFYAQAHPEKTESLSPNVETKTSSFSVSTLSSFDPDTQKAMVEKWCQEVSAAIKPFRWKVEPCQNMKWKVGAQSVQGRPLVYADFGDPDAANTTLVLSTIHGDEITPLYLALQLGQWLNAHQGQFGKTRVVIAPLVNPDGFFHSPKTRMNARGVDVNRNFETQDWYRTALLAWKKKFRKDPRRFPGHAPRSEPETLFQEALIHEIKPQKILAIHSPLNYLDYDGPSELSLSQFPTEYTQVCEKLKKSVKAVSAGFFPGSLGNFAGRELGIPTLTLELPSADPNKAETYWKNFTGGIWTMIRFEVPSFASGGPSPKNGG
ncbi:MAG: M14 family zinc carboxypeptidase [Bdellovibrionia bacterium]